MRAIRTRWRHGILGKDVHLAVFRSFEPIGNKRDKELSSVEKRRTKFPCKLHRMIVSAGITFGLTFTFGLKQADAIGVSSMPSNVEYYLALGGSGSLGVQPTIDHPKGQPTNVGYANDLLTLERARWRGLQLVQLGCPGETTTLFLVGGDSCRPAGQSQLTQSVSFLQSHVNTVLVTIDLGFNDIRRCLVYHEVNASCVSRGLATVRQKLTEILSALHAVDASLRLVGVGHYDPYLDVHVHNIVAPSFAQASIAVINRLNETLRSVYSTARVPMANVAKAFMVANVGQAALLDGNTIPRGRLRLCALTWACIASPLGHNQHPNEDGYEVIAEAIADVV